MVEVQLRPASEKWHWWKADMANGCWKCPVHGTLLFTNLLFGEAKVTLNCCLLRPTCSKKHWTLTRPLDAGTPSVSPTALSGQGDAAAWTHLKIIQMNTYHKCFCLTVCATWMEADATWPAWSKSRDTTWEKRLAFVFMDVELLPNASKMV